MAADGFSPRAECSCREPWGLDCIPTQRTVTMSFSTGLTSFGFFERGQVAAAPRRSRWVILYQTFATSCEMPWPAGIDVAPQSIDR
jgi:hypothetical protein